MTRGEDAVLNQRRAALDRARHVDAPLRRQHAIHQLRQCAERADAAAVHAAPQDRRDDRDRGEQIPRQAVAEDRQVAAEQAEDVDDGEQRALPDADVDHRRDQRHVLERHALAEEAGERQRAERDDEADVHRLRADVVRTSSAPLPLLQGSRIRRRGGRAPELSSLRRGAGPPPPSRSSPTTRRE